MAPALPLVRCDLAPRGHHGAGRRRSETGGTAAASGSSGARAIYGDDLGVIAQLEVDFADGHRQVVGTDESWRRAGLTSSRTTCTTARPSTPGGVSDAWLRPSDAGGPDGRAPSPLSGPHPRLRPQPPAALRRPTHDAPGRPAPTRIWSSPSRRTLVDFGQNLVGWLRFTVRGPRGSEIRIRHAEVLEHDELGTRPLRDAQATDRFILSGGDDFFEPTMTFHGFRYAEVTGWPSELGTADLEAVVVHSDLRRTGFFECSDPELNQFHRNVVWGSKGNFLDLPTDCPQRNERLGWTGDISAFAPSAAYLFDVEAFLADWLVDLALEQQQPKAWWRLSSPTCSSICPRRRSSRTPTAPLLERCGRLGAVDALPGVRRQGSAGAAVRLDGGPRAPRRDASVAHGPVGHLVPVRRLARPGRAAATSRGTPRPTAASSPPPASTSPPRSSRRRRSSSAAPTTPRASGALAERTRVAFNEHYVSDDATIRSDCTTVYTLAIVFGLLDDAMTSLAGERLAQLVPRAATGSPLASPAPRSSPTRSP